MIEMQRLQYTQSRNLNGMKSRKNTKIVYMYTCEQLESFFFLTWSQKYIKSSSLWYGVFSCGKSLNHLSKYKYKQHHSGMNGKYDILLLIMNTCVSFKNNFIIQFQSDLLFFSTEIVDYRSGY